MPSVLSRTMLFVSSYAPLLVILAIRNWSSRTLVVCLLGLAAASLTWLLLFIRQARTLVPTTIHIQRATSKDEALVGYIVSYLLPFLSIDFSRFTDLLSLIVLLVVIALLYVHSNLIYVNPLLAALHLHLIEIEESSGKVSILVSSRSYIRPGTRLRVVQAGDLLNLEVSDE